MLKLSKTRRRPTPLMTFTCIDVSAFSPQISDFKTPIVLDTGSGVMKAGFADEELPAIIFPTVIGLPKYEVMSADQVTVVGS